MKRHKQSPYILTFMILWIICFAGSDKADAAENRVFVLCYHSFLGDKRFDGDISMQEFHSQIDYFLSNGFRFVSYDDLLKGTVKGTKNLLMIIDDGNESAYNAYKEILKPLHIKPMLAIYPFVIGYKSYALTWNQLEELSKDGCDIASHGYYHELMNQRFYDRDKKGFHKEIFDSKKTLEKS